MELKEKLELKKLKDHNVAIVEVHYSGGGDDGCIDQILCKNIDDDHIDNINVDLEEYFYNYISRNIEWDWINNEGGYGCLTLNVETQKIEIDHSQRTVEDWHYDRDMEELKILDGTS